MNWIRQGIRGVIGAGVCTVAALHAAPPPQQDPGFDARMKPDSLLLKDGRQIYGLIVSNTATNVTLQMQFDEITVPKSEIVRIFDEDDESVYFTGVARKGTLPPWRVLVNDLRLHDRIRTFEQIAATVIDSGDFRNVPYQSFRINGDIELNIYGDPDDPAAIEIGVYGRRRGDRTLHHFLKQYIAGYLATTGEVGALYALPESGGEIDIGETRVFLTTPDAPDAYGAWWIGVMNPGQIESVRMSDADYARLVRPVDDVLDRHGRVLTSLWDRREVGRSRRASKTGGDAQIFLRGFYRDENGRFQLAHGNDSGQQ